MLLVQHASALEVVKQGIVLLGRVVGRLRPGRAGTRTEVWEECALGDAGVEVVDAPALDAVVEGGVRASLA